MAKDSRAVKARNRSQPQAYQRYGVVLDTSRAHDVLGFEPQYRLELPAGATTGASTPSVAASRREAVPCRPAGSARRSPAEEKNSAQSVSYRPGESCSNLLRCR